MFIYLFIYLFIYFIVVVVVVVVNDVDWSSTEYVDSAGLLSVQEAWCDHLHMGAWLVETCKSTGLELGAGLVEICKRTGL